MASKGLDPFRRYKKLQSLAKRIVFHLKLTNSGLLLVYPQSFSERDAENIGSALQSSVKQKVMKQRHETICDGRLKQKNIYMLKQRFNYARIKN